MGDVPGRAFDEAIPVVITDKPDAARLAEVVRGLEESGATLERIGKVLGAMVHGRAIDENGDDREGVRVSPREQAAAVRLALEVQGLMKKRVEQTNENVLRLRLDRANVGAGEIAGINGRLLRELSPTARDEVLRLLGPVKAERHGE